MPGILHVLNGHATQHKLEPSGVPGAFTVWADVLHDGPVPNLPPDELRRVRARHHEPYEAEPADGPAPDLGEWDAALDRYGDYEELVFWFEHDLFDQLILIRHLHWLSQIPPRDTRFSLICIGEYPGRPNFAGLGELSPPELAGLFPARQAITEEQIELGSAAWDLFRAPDPTALQEWIGVADTSALPYLSGAVHRHFEDFPAASNGLSRSERQILRAIAQGSRTPGEIFVATQKMEERIFMGDLTFWGIVRRLAAAAQPLVTIHARDITRMPIHDGAVELTDDGHAVLSEKADHIALNGIDRWMGGAHLTTERYWRWSGSRLRLS